MSQQILTLQLKNYRRFVETGLITFEPGLTIVSGQNGAGKSTLIEAFIYALFGPNSKRGHGINDIRTDSLNEPVRVDCNLCIDDQEIYIIRSGNAAELRINGIIQVQGGAASGKSVTSRVIALLGGLTREQFACTYVALQGDTAGLVTEKASDRRQVIEKILQLEVLTKAVELQLKRCEEAKGGITSLGNHICQDLSLDAKTRGFIQSFRTARTIETKSLHTQQLLKSIEQVITERKQQHEEAQQRASKIQIEISTLKEQLQQYQRVIEQEEKAYQQQEELQKEFNDYQAHIANVDGKIEQCTRDIRKHQDTIQQTIQYADAATAYHQLQEDITNNEKRLDHIPLIRNCYDSFVKAQKQLNDLDDQLRALRSVDEELLHAQGNEQQAMRQLEMLRNNDPTQADYKDWLTQDSKIDHEKRQNEEAFQLLTNGANNALCPTCNQHFTEHTPESRIQHLHTWLNETLPLLQEELRQQKLDIDKRKQEWEQEKRKAGSDYNKLQKDVVTIEKKISTRDTLLTQHKGSYQDFLTSQQAWLALEENTPDAQEALTLRNKLNDLNTQASLLKTQADTYAQLHLFKQNLAEKQQEQERLEHEKRPLLDQQHTLNYSLENFQAAKDALAKVHEESNEMQNQLHQIDLLLKDAQSSAQQVQKNMEAAQLYHNRFETCVREYYRDERLHEHLEEFKKHFFGANTEEVMRRTTELLMHAITDQSILGVKFDGEEFQYLDASYSARPISRLSGGEKALVGLCLRIALAEQAQTITRTGRVKFLVLDEVLSSLDEERCEAVKRIFDSVLQRGIFDHIIMITHLDTVKQSWHAHGLAVQKLDGKISTVISVSPGEVPMDLAEEIGV